MFSWIQSLLNLTLICYPFVYICVDIFFRFKFVSSYFFCLLFHLVQCGTCSTWIACKNFTLVEKISWIRQQKFSLPWFHYKNKNKTSTHNHKANFNWFLPRFSFHPFSQLVLFLYFCLRFVHAIVVPRCIFGGLCFTINTAT